MLGNNGVGAIKPKGEYDQIKTKRPAKKQLLSTWLTHTTTINQGAQKIQSCFMTHEATSGRRLTRLRLVWLITVDTVEPASKDIRKKIVIDLHPNEPYLRGGLFFRHLHCFRKKTSRVHLYNEYARTTI